MKKLFSITIASGILTLARIFSGVIIVKMVAVYTGPSGLVMIGQVQNLVAALNGVVAAPGGNGLVRYTAEHREKGLTACAPWWSATFKWGLALMLPLLLFSALFSESLAAWLFENRDYTWLVLLTLSVMPLAMGNTFIASVLNGQEKYRRFIVLGLISALATTLTTILLISSNGLVGALAAAALSTGIAGTIMILGCWRESWFSLKHWWVHTDLTQLKGVGGYVLMALTTAITAPLTMISIRKILIETVGWEYTGYWQAVYKISEVYLSVITIALGTYFLPKLSSLSGYASIKNAIDETTRLILPMVAVMALSVYFLRDYAIEILFTKSFEPARDLFAVQLTGDVVKILSWFYAYPMISTGAVRWFVVTETAFSICLVLITYIFVQNIGVEGAVLAYLVNYSLYFLFVYMNFSRIVR